MSQTCPVAVAAALGRAVAVLLVLHVGVLLPDLLDGQDAPDPVAVAVPLGFRRPSVARIAWFHPHHLVAQCSVWLDWAHIDIVDVLAGAYAGRAYPDAGNASSHAGKASTISRTTFGLRSIPLCPTPPTVSASTSALIGTDRRPGTTTSNLAVKASHRTPSGNGPEASRRNSGEPSRSARAISPNGSRLAHGEPPNGDPRVTTVSTCPLRRPSAMAWAMMTKGER